MFALDNCRFTYNHSIMQYLIVFHFKNVKN